MKAALILLSVLYAGTASAQVYGPGQPYVGDPMADRLRDRMETQRLQSNSRRPLPASNSSMPA